MKYIFCTDVKNKDIIHSFEDKQVDSLSLLDRKEIKRD